MSTPQTAPQRPRWALVAHETPGSHPDAVAVRFLILTEDAVEAARARGWTIIATESDILTEPI